MYIYANSVVATTALIVLLAQIFQRCPPSMTSPFLLNMLPTTNHTPVNVVAVVVVGTQFPLLKRTSFDQHKIWLPAPPPIF